LFHQLPEERNVLKSKRSQYYSLSAPQ